MNTPRTCMIATVRDEGPWLLEWVAHNIAIGFDGLVICSNDCTDGTDAMLDRLAALGHVAHVDNPPPYNGLGHNIQIAAYTRARFTPEVANAEWVITLDADEFLNIKPGDGTIQDLIASFPPHVDAVPIAWRIFGDSGLSGWIEGDLCDALTSASRPDRPHAYKVLFRKHRLYPRFGVHRPRFLPHTRPEHIPALIYASPDGEELEADRFLDPTKGFKKIATCWSVVQINHYMVRTRELFALKSLRGDPVQTGRDKEPIRRHSAEAFAGHNRNDMPDRSIARTGTRRKAVLQELRADPVLRALETEATRIAKGRMAQALEILDAGK